MDPFQGPITSSRFNQLQPYALESKGSLSSDACDPSAALCIAHSYLCYSLLSWELLSCGAQRENKARTFLMTCPLDPSHGDQAHDLT